MLFNFSSKMYLHNHRLLKVPYGLSDREAFQKEPGTKKCPRIAKAVADIA